MDTDYDRDRASDGVSRFGAYLRQAGHGFTEDGDWYDDPAVAWAARVWTTACPPVMCPGFVAWHPRVISAQAERDDWAGDLLITVRLISTLPEPVARAAGWSWKSWEYSEWSERFDGPELHQAGRDKALLPTMTALVLIPARSVEVFNGPPDQDTAATVVQTICDVLNDELGPIVAALDGGGRR